MLNIFSIYQNFLHKVKFIKGTPLLRYIFKLCMPNFGLIAHFKMEFCHF